MKFNIQTISFADNQKLSIVKIKEIKNRIFLEKRYYGGVLRVLLENDPYFYRQIFFHNHKNIPMLSIHELKQESNRISSILFYITHKCNMYCNICYENAGKNDPKKEVSIKDIKRVITNVKGKYIVLLGGEPTLKKSIFRIIKLIVKTGNIPSIHTNGIKLANLEYAKKLKKSGLDVVHLSFNSFSDHINEKINNMSLSRIKLKALENIRKVGMKAILSTNVIKNINEDEIAKLINLMLNNNDFIKGIFLRPMLHGGRINLNIKDELTISDIAKRIEKETNKKISRQHFVENRKLRINMFKIAKIFWGEKAANKFLPEIALSVLLYKEGNAWKTYPEIEILKKLNKLMGKVNNKKELIINSIKNLPWLLKFVFQKMTLRISFSLIKHKCEMALVANDLLHHKNVVRIWIDVIQTPKNVDLLNPSRTYLFNSSGNITPIVLLYGIGPT